MSLDDILTPREKNHLRSKLKKLSPSELLSLANRLCNEEMVKDSLITLLMVYGLKNPNAANFLPTIED